MASRCSKCNNIGFEMVEETPKGSAFKLMFIRCISCHSVVGVMDYYNIGYLLKTLAQKLGFNI